MYVQRHYPQSQVSPSEDSRSSLGGPGTSAGVCPCTLPGQDSQGPTCLLLYSQLLSYALRSPQLVLQTSPGIQQWPPGCQERLEKCGTPPLRCLIWSTTQLEVQKHHHIFQVFPQSQRINTSKPDQQSSIKEKWEGGGKIKTIILREQSPH